MNITLKYDAVCADCGAKLAAGSKARFFRDGSVYGNACHRWQVEVDRADVEALATAARRVKAASRDRKIPARAAALLKRLKSKYRTITPTNCKRLLGDLDRAAQMIEEGK